MTFLRQLRSAAIGADIARRTSGLVETPFSDVDFAPHVCPRCHGGGTWRSAPAVTCHYCGGTGITRGFDPDDTSYPVLLRGPCGAGTQSLLAVALADGRVAFVHVRQEGDRLQTLYIRPRADVPAAVGCVGTPRWRSRARRPSAVSPEEVSLRHLHAVVASGAPLRPRRGAPESRAGCGAAAAGTPRGAASRSPRAPQDAGKAQCSAAPLPAGWVTAHQSGLLLRLPLDRARVALGRGSVAQASGAAARPWARRAAAPTRGRGRMA